MSVEMMYLNGEIDKHEEELRQLKKVRNGIMKFYRTETDYKMGVMMIINFLEFRTKDLYYATAETTTNNFEAFKKETKDDGYITVSRDGCENSIYGEARLNILARLWHDIWHLELNAPFDADGEELVAEAQCQEMTDWLRSENVTERSIEAARNILYRDIMAQVEYYAKYNRFVPHQELFIKNDYLNNY